ncbi:hypothetical protein BH24CHL9_BH24CHL9_16430 [soil metagenome]
MASSKRAKGSTPPSDKAVVKDLQATLVELIDLALAST